MVIVFLVNRCCQEGFFLVEAGNGLEEELGCKEKMDKLEERFDYFLSDNKISAANSSAHFLRLVKSFLGRDRKYRENLFEHSRLSGSDCLTLSVLGVLLARRRGLNAQIAIPRRISRLLHAVIVYPEGNQKKVFVIAGNAVHRNPRIIGSHELRARLKLTKPFVNFANKTKAYFYKNRR